MGNTQVSRRVFEQLDKSRSGYLDLAEILGTDESDISSQLGSCSLPVLFYFDESKKGTISAEDYDTLDKFVHNIAKKLKKKMRKGDGKPNMTRRVSSKYLSGDDLKEISGYGDIEHLKGHQAEIGGTEGARMQTQFYYSEGEEQKDKPNFRTALKSEVSMAMMPRLNRELFGSEKRRALFLEWLFKFVDIEHNSRISMEELQRLIDAVSKDGIDVRQLVFDEYGDSSPVEAIMKEYDCGGTGFLTEAEFYILGELVLRQYQDSGATEKLRVGDYRLTYRLGKGGYGTVKAAVNDRTGEDVAVKIIPRGRLSEMSRLDVEIQIMKTLDHPNVIHLYNVIETEQEIYMIMELCGGGSLFEYMQSRPLPRQLCRCYFQQLVGGLHYCHSNGVCHRDLKLENLLLDNNGNMKISDFGQAAIFKSGWDIFATNLVGSLYHLAPEQIEGKCFSGQKVDIWSLGVMLYRLSTGQLPFLASDVGELMTLIKAGDYSIPQSIEKDQDLCNLIKSILVLDPESRLSLAEITRHKWFVGEVEQPVLMHHELVLRGEFGTGETAVQRLRRVFSRSGVHTVVTQGQDDAVRILRCHYPRSRLKFAVRMFTIPDRSLVRLHFILRKGEARVMRKLFVKTGYRLTKYMHNEDGWLSEYSTDDG